MLPPLSLAATSAKDLLPERCRVHMFFKEGPVLC